MNYFSLLGNLLVFLATPLLIQAQSFQEICASSNLNGTVVDFERFQDTIYATGFFSQICGEQAGYIARWENGEWVPTSWGISDPGHSLRQIGDRLFVARYEESIDSNWVYYYEEGQLHKWGEGIYLSTASGFSELPNIYDIAEYNGTLIACGEFDQVGSQEIEGIMQWDGSQWAPLAGGLSGNIINTAPVRFPHQLLVDGDDLYVVGNFRFADDIEVNGIARWDGQNWHPVGAGFNSTAYAITKFEGQLWVGGSFTQSGNTPLNRIARWNGNDWESIEFGFTNASPNDFTFVHTFYQGDSEGLFIAGGLKEITYADNTTADCGGIVYYENEVLETFQGGVANNDIEAVIFDEDELLIGGGVFNSGYLGILEQTLHSKKLPSATPMAVFPNPFQSEIVLTPNSFEAYELFNIQGELIQAGSINEAVIPVGSIPAGIYLLRVSGPDRPQQTLRVVKQ